MCVMQYVILQYRQPACSVGDKASHTETDPEYISAKADDFRSSQSLIHKSLRATIVKRQFLLKLKAKYAGVLLAYLIVLIFLGCFFSLRWPKDC